MDEVIEMETEQTMLNTRMIFYTRPGTGYAAPITCLTSRVFSASQNGFEILWKYGSNDGKNERLAARYR